MLGELFRRRVPQIVGLYMVGSWGFVEATDWAVEQYVLSPHITNFVVALLLLLLPSVMLLAWRYGAPGDDHWTRTESIAIPLNLVVAAAVLYVGFHGEYLGAATTTVLVENEAGDPVERVVPRDELRRSIALFFFENETGDTTFNWLSHGLLYATEADLSQDMFITVVSPWADDGLLRELEEAGFEDGVGAPLALQRKLAVDRHVDVVLTGSLTSADSGLVVESELYDGPRGRLVARHTFSGADPFELADQMSDQLKRDLGLPTLQIEDAQDLPASEILTSSVGAFRQYALGRTAALGSDFDAAERWLAGAVEEDPAFAWAQWFLAASYYYLNRPEEAAAAAQAVHQHLYKLPERYQLSFRTFDYLVLQQEPEQAFKTARYWAELYPQDLEGRGFLAVLYEIRGQWEEQIAQLEAILSIDSSRQDLLKEIGAVYEEHGQYDMALGYYERYAELFPSDHESFVSIGEVRRLMGEHEMARSAFERALLIEPREATVMTKLLRLERDLGNFEVAHEWAEKALAASRGPEDRLEANDFLETLYYRQGLFGRVEDTYPQILGAAAESEGPFSALTTAQALTLQAAHEVGREASAFQQLDSLRAGLPSPFDDLFGLMYLIPLARSGDVERARAELERGNQGIAAFGFEAFNGHAAYGTGLISEQEMDCPAAVASYRQAVSLEPGSLDYATALSRCQRKLGDLEAAEATLQGVLKVVPADAKARYQLALVYEDRGRSAAAIEQLEMAADIWKNADPDYRPAERAQAKLADLRASGTSP